MASSSNHLPLAWIDGDLTLPHMPKFRLKKRTHRDKSSLLKLLRHVPTMRETRNKRLANKPPAADQDNIPPCTIPNIKGTMNPTLVFGLQVETLISRDKAMLEREKISASEPDSLNSTILQRKRAVEHAKLVVKQIGQRSSKRRCAKRSGKISDQNTEIFRFMGLPPEIRDMIYTCYFMNSSGEKPRLMWAFKINGVKIKGDFYDAAEKVYYTVNSWTFSIRDCLKNSILGSMDQFHVEMIRKMTIEIPKEIQACTVLSSAISRAVNINELTLSARSDTGIRRAMHELMPGFKHLRRITLNIQRPRDLNASLRRDNPGTEYYKLFRSVREMLHRVLGQEGRLIQETARVQEWRWETDGLKVFKITCPKKHIKFE